MSISQNRAWSNSALAVVAATAVLALGACHHALSSAPQPTAVDSTRGRAQSKDDHTPRRFPGVDIVPTSRAGFVVRIHSGMVRDGEPLYVIDGAPMKVPSNRGIDWFTPDDIVEIKVLKAPHELAEYGTSGANGVVVITTRQNPGRSRKP